MSSSCIPSLLLQSLYVVGLGAEPGLYSGKVLGGGSGGLSGQGDLDIECCDSLLIVGSGCTCSKDTGSEGDTLGE